MKKQPSIYRIGVPNKRLVPTRKSEALLLAAQPKR